MFCPHSFPRQPLHKTHLLNASAQIQIKDKKKCTTNGYKQILAEVSAKTFQPSKNVLFSLLIPRSKHSFLTFAIKMQPDLIMNHWISLQKLITSHRASLLIDIPLGSGVTHQLLSCELWNIYFDTEQFGLCFLQRVRTRQRDQPFHARNLTLKHHNNLMVKQFYCFYTTHWKPLLINHLQSSYTWK